MDLTGEWLKLIKELDPLPVGIVVYCIVDEGFQFRVRTSQVYHGVQEFIYNPDKKDRFILYV
jgi:hypothetical protein